MFVRFVALALMLMRSLPSGQQAVAPPPKPADSGWATADNGPSLADTMKYIEEKLNNITPVSFTAYPTDGSASFQMGRAQYKFHYTADASACSLTEDMEIESGNIRHVVPLRSVSKIEVAAVSTNDPNSHYRLEPDPPELRVTTGTLSIETISTHPDRLFKTDKKHPVAPIVTEKTTAKVWVVVFDDADAADRTAKALLHAVELCGGAQKKELF